MSARAPKFEVFQGHDGFWYWHLRSKNGEVICQSEAYTRRGDATRGAKTLQRTAGMAVIVSADRS